MMAKTTAKAKEVNKNFAGPTSKTASKNTIQMDSVETNAGIVLHKNKSKIACSRVFQN